MNNNISFQANYIKPVYIQKDQGYGNFKPYRVSVCELDINNNKDRQALHNVAFSWGNDNYAADINFDIALCLSSKEPPREHFFIITSQCCDFENLRPSEVMGVAEFEEGLDTNNLNYIQINPEQNYTNPFREYKHIGQAMLNFLATYSQKPLKIYPVESAYEFYKKNNFVPMPENKHYLWNA